MFRSVISNPKCSKYWTCTWKIASVGWSDKTLAMRLLSRWNRLRHPSRRLQLRLAASVDLRLPHHWVCCLWNRFWSTEGTTVNRRKPICPVLSSSISTRNVLLYNDDVIVCIFVFSFPKMMNFTLLNRDSINFRI